MEVVFATSRGSPRISRMIPNFSRRNHAEEQTMTSRLIRATVVGLIAASGVAAEAPIPGPLLPAVRAFLDSLSEDQRAKAVLPFNSDERMNWHYFPKVRGGIPYAD